MGCNGDTTMAKLAATPGAMECFLSHCPEGILSREAIELSILFEAANPLEKFWNATVVSALKGVMPQEEIDRRYQALLADINRFH